MRTGDPPGLPRHHIRLSTTTRPPPGKKNKQVEDLVTHSARNKALLLARSSGDSVASGGSVASASVVEAGRARVLKTEVAMLKAKLQVRRLI